MRHTILIIEDEPHILKLVKSILAREKSYDVRCATSADAGLHIGLDLTIPIDLLLANVILQGTIGTVGTDLAAKIKAARPRMHVILLNGKDDGELEVLDKGWQLIEKRFIREELLGRVRRELSGQGMGGG